MYKNQTVFVVDDDSAAAASVAALLASVGLQPRIFDSAEAFLDAFDGSQSGCLILDIRLRGMSGLELHKELQNRDVAIPIIFISGHIDSATCETNDQNVIAFLEKPYSGQDLCGLVKIALAAMP